MERVVSAVWNPMNLSERLVVALFKVAVLSHSRCGVDKKKLPLRGMAVRS